MSTSVTQSGTTTGAGRSGKGIGFAAAALAVVIAAGFVFALNQGNEAASQASARPNPAAELERLNDLAARLGAQSTASAEIERLNDLAIDVQMKTHPDSAAENVRYQLTQAGLLDSGTYVPSIVQPVEAVPERMDGNIDVVKSELEQAGLMGQTVVSERSEGNLDLIRAQAKAQATRQDTELDQPEWDKRMY